MIRRRQSQQHHRSVCAGLWAHTERVRVGTDAGPEWLAPLPRHRPVGLRGA